MALSHKTHIFCLDDHRSFSEEIRKRFTDTSRYEVSVSYNADDLLRLLNMEKSKRVCKLIIIGLHDSRESYAGTEQLVNEIKKADPETGVLLVVSQERLNDAEKQLRFNIDAFIPRNSSTVLRVHNAVKKHISEHNLKIYRKRRNISFILLVICMVVAIIVLLVARIKFPEYF